MPTGIVRKTIIPHRAKTYSSFPTFVEHSGHVYLYYRQAVTNTLSCHGFDGVIKCLRVAVSDFVGLFDRDDTSCFAGTGHEKILFNEGNEFDAIVSRLGDNLFSLATRSYDNHGKMKTFLSFSDTPSFGDRKEITVKGVAWLVFYGKGSRWKGSYIFPAYGRLKNEHFDRPFLIVTNDLDRFDLLSCLPGTINGSTLNESSLVFDGTHYLIFMRDDTYPFGIWQSRSTDLQNWEQPVKLITHAHAPMCCTVNNTLYITFRDLRYLNATGVTMTRFGTKDFLLLDSYNGSPYHGGYTDTGIIGDNIYVFYYIGNKRAEPYIKCCRIETTGD